MTKKNFYTFVRNIILLRGKRKLGKVAFIFLLISQEWFMNLKIQIMTV